MARHLDLEEQEQLDELKHFWNRWGNLITWFLIAVLGAYAAWNGWNYWQQRQAAQASVLYDEVDRAAAAGDVARVQQAYGDIKDKFGGTVYAQQAALIAAKAMLDKGQADAAKSALQWVADSASDEGIRAVARLRLAAVMADAKAYDDALKLLGAGFPKEFEGLAADRRGDVLNLQGKKAEAKAEYTKAWQSLDEETSYRGLVEVKLTALGVDVQAMKPAKPAAANASAAKS